MFGKRGNVNIYWMDAVEFYTEIRGPLRIYHPPHSHTFPFQRRLDYLILNNRWDVALFCVPYSSEMWVFSTQPIFSHASHWKMFASLYEGCCDARRLISQVSTAHKDTRGIFLFFCRHIQCRSIHRLLPFVCVTETSTGFTSKNILF